MSLTIPPRERRWLVVALLTLACLLPAGLVAAAGSPAEVRTTYLALGLVSLVLPGVVAMLCRIGLTDTPHERT